MSNARRNDVKLENPSQFEDFRLSVSTYRKMQHNIVRMYVCTVCMFVCFDTVWLLDALHFGR